MVWMAPAPTGVDLAKNVIQVHGVDTDGRTVLRRQLGRNQFSHFSKVDSDV
jgi:hypothetical protein